MIYRGRFAPSPTGPLHAGSLLTAVGSYIDARANNGQWLVRIEDLDQPRSQPGAETQILEALEAYHLHWDGAVIRQSERTALYQSVLEQLIDQGAAYPCTCSRAELSARNALHHYDRHCLKNPLQPGRNQAYRLLAQGSAEFTDRLQGRQLSPAGQCGDFVIFRRDGYFAYHLAVVVDDQRQNISQVVRGSDLLEETAKHILLQRTLNYPTPSYLHLPLVLASDGQKLSKQSFARPLPLGEAEKRQQLCSALSRLGQQPPAELQSMEIDEILSWAITHWNIKRIPKNGVYSHEQD